MFRNKNFGTNKPSLNLTQLQTNYIFLLFKEEFHFFSKILLLFFKAPRFQSIFNIFRFRGPSQSCTYIELQTLTFKKLKTPKVHFFSHVTTGHTILGNVNFTKILHGCFCQRKLFPRKCMFSDFLPSMAI